MTDHSIEPGHGDSVASWTTVTLIMLAVTAGTLFFWFDIAWAVWASAAFIPVSLLIGWALKAAGYGVNGSKSKGSGH